MAIEYAHISIISRNKGHSAVKAAAYRSGTKLQDNMYMRKSDYANRISSVSYSNILIPENAPEKLRDRETLWNAVESAEKRKDSQLAKDNVIALPRGLSNQQHIEMVNEFAREQFVSHGLIADINIHHHSEGNPHAHIMTTTRPIEGDKFGKKARTLNPTFVGSGIISPEYQLRHAWSEYQNKYFEINGIDEHVINNNGQYISEVHVGSAHYMDSEKNGIFAKAQREKIVNKNIQRIRDNPSIIIDSVAENKSVFTKYDLYRELSKKVGDAEIFREVKAKLDVSDSLIPISDDRNNARHFTTEKVMEVELGIKVDFEILSRKSDNIGVSKPKHTKVKNKYDYLSEDQQIALDRVTDNRRLSVVVGLAGAGKSTMLKAANESWSDSGFKVHGIALAGKAAQGLQESSDIKSSTIHRMLFDLDRKNLRLTDKSVVVMDEAGMVNNKLMASVIEKVQHSGAKLVLVGDGEQLQPIQAGNPFRTAAQQAGYAEINTIRRQVNKDEQQATFDLSQGKAFSAIRTYDEKGAIKYSDNLDLAKLAIAKSYLSEDREVKTMAVLAHRRKDVDDVNKLIRSELIERGEIRGETEIKTDGGSISIGIGDRLLFTRNDQKLDVKNGTLGTVKSIKSDKSTLSIMLDDGRKRLVDTDDYNDLTHGFAMTIHKSQGVTVDHTKLLASNTFDKHLAYVGMSRHRESMELYSNHDDFENLRELASSFGRTNRQTTVDSFAEEHGIAYNNNSNKFEKINDIESLEPIKVPEKEQNTVSTLQERMQQGHHREDNLKKDRKQDLHSRIMQGRKNENSKKNEPKPTKNLDRNL